MGAQVTSGKTATIQNCRVSTSFTSTLSGDNSSGSFVGVVWSGGTLNITGCAFTGSLTGSGNAFGGFLGYKEGTCSVTNSLFAPASVTVSTDYAGTFSRPSAPTITNCYFTRTFGGAQGMQARTIAKGSYVSSLSVTKGAATATYDISGITVYSSGIDFNSTFYGGSGESVSLSLTPDSRSGYQFKQYAVDNGSISAQTTNTPTITMPAANSTANDAVTISAEYDPLYNTTFATGNDNSGWTITPTQQIEGGTVTVSYSGEHKVKSVTVTNKYAIAHSLAASVVGDVVGTDGNAYSVAEKNKLPVGVTAEAVVCYKSGSNGLAVALVNLSGTFGHEEAVDYSGSNYTGFCTAHPVSGQTWKVLSQDEFSNVYNGCGGTAPTAIYPADGYSGNRGSLDTYITNAGGTAMSGNYWTATTYTGAENCFVCTNILSGNVCNFNYNNTTYKLNVRYGFTF